MKKYILLGITLFGILLLPGISHASSCGSQLTNNGDVTFSSPRFSLTFTCTTGGVNSDILYGHWKSGSATMSNAYGLDQAIRADTVSPALDLAMIDSISFDSGVTWIASSTGFNINTIGPNTEFWTKSESIGGWDLNGVSVDFYSGANQNIGLVGNTGSNVPFVEISTDPPVPSGPSPTIKFAYPFNGSSTPNFRNWMFQFNVATSTNTLWSITVNYGLSSSSLNYTDHFPTYSGTYQSTAGFLPITVTAPKGITFSQGETIYAQATLLMVDANNCPQWTPCLPQTVNTGLISFNIDNTLTITPYDFLNNANSILYTTSTVTSNEFSTAAQYVVQVTNPTQAQNYFGSTGITATSTLASSTEALAAQCQPANDWTDIGGGIRYGFCATINFLFVPSPEQAQSWNDSVIALENAPPFVWLTGTENIIVTSITSSTAQTVDITATDAPTFDGGTGQLLNATDTWVVATTHPMTGQAGAMYETAKEVWFNFVILFVITVFTLLLIVLLKHLH